MPDMITTAKALGNGFPVSALLLTPPITASLKLENLGTTFGGGPMACAVAEATLDAIEKEGLLDNVTRVSAYLRKTCKVGPVVDFQGLGFLHGPADEQTREGHAEGAARERHPRGHRGRSRDPAPAARIHSQRGTHRPAARGSRRSLTMNNFLDLADLSREQVVELLALAERLQKKPEPQALAGKILGLLFFNPCCARSRPFQAAMARLGGNSFVISAGQGTWQLETRRGAVMNGAPAEHVREGVPVLAHYCDALGIRAFAGGIDLAADLAETAFKEMVGLVNKPVINMESAANHPCQALADWKTLDDLTVPRRARFVLSWVNHPRALPLAVPAATVHMAAMRGMEVVVLRPEGFALPAPIMQKAAAAAAAAGGIAARNRRSRRRA